MLGGAKIVPYDNFLKIFYEKFARRAKKIFSLFFKDF